MPAITALTQGLRGLIAHCWASRRVSESTYTCRCGSGVSRQRRVSGGIVKDGHGGTHVRMIVECRDCCARRTLKGDTVQLRALVLQLANQEARANARYTEVKWDGVGLADGTVH